MTPRRCIPLILLLLTVASLPLAALGRGRSNPAYDGRVDFGPQLLHSESGCLFVDGSVTSGSFFEDLKRVSVGDRFEYQKHGKLVTEYPESLTTSVRVLGNQCDSASTNAPSAIFSESSYGLKFEVSWKDGMDLRPAELSSTAASCRGFNSITIPDKGFTIPTVTCQITVKAHGVPLGDHLIVLVFAPDGTPVTRLSAAP
jgi:hypothetical protein